MVKRITGMNNKTSYVNSSNTPLDNGVEFIGIGEQNHLPNIMVSVSTDQNGTLYIEFSPDGTNWDSSLLYHYDTERINGPHILIKGDRYSRIRFVNDSGSNQTFFRLHTDYGAYDQLTTGLHAIVAENYDSVITRPTDYYSEVALELRQGSTTINKWGTNEDVDTASSEIVAHFGGAFDPNTDIIKTAQTFTITYDGTGGGSTDGSGTTGALSLLFTYIDADFLTQDATHTLGTDGSDVTSFTGIGINRVRVASNGGLGWNANNILVTATSDATNQAEIPAETSVTEQAIFHTQINHTLLLDYLFLNALKATPGGAPVVIFNIYEWSRITQTRYEIFHWEYDTSDKQEHEFRFVQKIPVQERSVIYIMITTDIDNTSVNCRFSGIEERID